MTSKRFRIAFSFAGEKRDFLAQVAAILAERFGEAAILYDKYHEAEFARRNLGIYLPELYHKESDLVVVVVCPNYDEKEWTGLEWAAIHDLLKQRKDNEVMLCRFEHAEITGLYSTAGFVELDHKTPEQAATSILERLALNEGRPKTHYEPLITDPQHWERLQPQLNVFDHLPHNQKWHTLSSKVIENFLGKTRVQVQDDYLVGLSAVEQFRRFKFIGDDGDVFKGAYLCFADSPDVTIPGATTMCYHWKGSTQASKSEHHDSRKGLLQQFDEAVGFLKGLLGLERQITDAGRSDVLEIPEDVLEEAVANALVHRDYRDRNECVMVSVYEDRIEIISPGLLPPPLNVEMIGEITTSHPRNPQIARIFYLSGYVERAGSGIQRMTSSLAARGLPPPEFAETEDQCFKVILRRPSEAFDKPASLKVLTSTTPNNLPRLQPFFGRTQELTQIAEALDPESRTWGALIDGPGGMGKTSLAVRAAYECPPGQFQRIIFLSVKDRELDDDGERQLGAFILPGFLEMLNELARELDRPEITKAAETERIRLTLDALGPAQALLILDNLESLTKNDRDQLFTFVKRLPQGCKAILTSRRRIGSSADVLILDKLDQKSGLECLEEIAKHHPLLAKTSERERRSLYQETGGVPLLLRWTAGQLGRGNVRTIGGALALLRSCPPDNDPLEFIFGDLAQEFTAEETQVLVALTYFTLPAKVEHIATVAGLSAEPVETTLRTLANRSLVVADQEERAFALVPMVADFLRRKRREAVAETGTRLVQHAYALIVENGYDEHDRFPVLDEAWPTVAPALPLLVAGENARLQTVSAALSSFLNFTGRWDELLSLSQQAETKAVEENDYDSAGWRAYESGMVHFRRKQADQVLACAERAATLWQTADAGTRERTFAIQLSGIGHQLKEDYAAAITAYRQALALRRTLSAESKDVASALNALAEAERLSGDLDAAERDYREALRLARTVNSEEGVAIYLGNLAGLARDREDWSSAESFAREALHLAEQVGRQELIALDCHRLAEAMSRQGKRHEALAYAQRAVAIFTQLRVPSGIEAARKTILECEGLTPLAQFL